MCDTISKTLQPVSMNPGRCNFLLSLMKKNDWRANEQLLLRLITIRHIGLLLSAISFGFQVGEKYILGIIQCPIIIISETRQLVRKLTFCFILVNIFTKNMEPMESCAKIIVQKFSFREISAYSTKEHVLAIHGAGLNAPI